jgi:hypothetical protein
MFILKYILPLGNHVSLFASNSLSRIQQKLGCPIHASGLATEESKFSKVQIYRFIFYQNLLHLSVLFEKSEKSQLFVRLIYPMH